LRRLAAIWRSLATRHSLDVDHGRVLQTRDVVGFTFDQSN
jgi:hypothetical protein